MCGFSISVLAGVIANAVFLFALASAGWCFIAIARRPLLYKFWGLGRVPKIRIYLSHLRIVSGGAIGGDGRPRSFEGSAVTRLESEMGDLVRRLFFASLPGWAVQPDWLKNLLLINADAEVLPAPLAGQPFDGEGAVVSLGSPAYNRVSREIESASGCPVRTVPDGGEIQLPDGQRITGGCEGVLLRWIHADRSWFYAVGLSEAGTAAAAYYLATNWPRLHRRYGGATSFYVVVECAGGDYRAARLIHEASI